MIPEVDLFLFIFWKKSRTPKNISKLTDLYPDLEIQISCQKQ